MRKPGRTCSIALGGRRCGRGGRWLGGGEPGLPLASLLEVTLAGLGLLPVGVERRQRSHTADVKIRRDVARSGQDPFSGKVLGFRVAPPSQSRKRSGESQPRIANRSARRADRLLIDLHRLAVAPLSLG